MAERNPLVASGDTYTTSIPRDKSFQARWGIQSLGGASGFTGIIEGSMDNGVTWEPVLALPAGGGAASSALSTVSSSTLPVPGYTDTRLRCTALASGGPVQARINLSEGI